MKQLILVLASIIVLGCANQPANVTVAKSLPYIRPAVAVAASGVLLLAANDQDRADIAGDIYTVAGVVYSLSGGAAPSPDQLQKSIALATPKSKEWTVLATTIQGIYAGFYPSIKGDPKLALQVLGQIAAGAQDAAAAYISKPGS